MDITNFIISRREKALLVGDYGSYRKQLSRRLLVLRRKLNYTSTKGRKYAAKAPVTAEDIANNHEFVSPSPTPLNYSNGATDSSTYSYLHPSGPGLRPCT